MQLCPKQIVFGCRWALAKRFANVETARPVARSKSSPTCGAVGLVGPLGAGWPLKLESNELSTCLASVWFCNSANHPDWLLPLPLTSETLASDEAGALPTISYCWPFRWFAAASSWRASSASAFTPAIATPLVAPLPLAPAGHLPST